jgi:hypothetical protein
MKLFEDENSWNWVDENNVVLGFRNSSRCCEQFGYRYFTKEPTDDISLKDEEARIDSLDDFVFDTSYCIFLHNSSSDCGGYVAFRIVNKNTNETIYLTIYNHHNGWYSHGFQFKYKDRIIREGIL